MRTDISNIALSIFVILGVAIWAVVVVASFFVNTALILGMWFAVFFIWSIISWSVVIYKYVYKR